MHKIEISNKINKNTMGAEKIGGTSSPTSNEEERHQAEVERQSKVSTVLPTFEVTASNNNNEITTKMGDLTGKFGSNPSRTNPSGYVATLKTHYTQKKKDDDSVSKYLESKKQNYNKSLETHYTEKPKSGK